MLEYMYIFEQVGAREFHACVMCILALKCEDWREADAKMQGEVRDH